MSDVAMGRADILWRFLQLARMDRPRTLDPYTEDLDLSADAQPLSVQVADRILTENPSLVSLYQQASEELAQNNPYATSPHQESNVELALAFNSFMNQWIGFERLLIQIQNELGDDWKGKTRSVNILAFDFLLNREILSNGQFMMLKRLRNIRNEIVHGRRAPETETLSVAAQELISIRRAIETQFPRAQGITPEIGAA